MSYADFLASKAPKSTKVGPHVTVSDVSPFLHDWQRELTAWAVATGRAALWEDTGLGKTVQQIEWARLVADGGTSLILAPLAVTQQTVREAAKLGIEARYVREGYNLSPGIYVTNYEMVRHFPPENINAVVLDEASILKQSDGKMRTQLIDQFADVPYRLACTATPAPNDPEELTNQAAFLGRSSRVDMLAAYFVHDSEGWRLKGHARAAMMKWMATWAVALRKPSDMGYSDEGYDLPGLRILPSLVRADIDTPGQLFTIDIGGVSDRAKVRRETLVARCDRAVEIVNLSHHLATDGHILAAWDGSQSTPTRVDPSTNLMATSGSAGSLKVERLNSSVSTTDGIRRSSSAPQPSRPRSIGVVGNGTHPIPSIESGPSSSPGEAILPPSAAGGLNVSLVSTLPSTTRYSPSKTDDAPSAKPTLVTRKVDATPSITVTPLVESEESFAASAISASDSSEISQRSSEPLRITSNELEPWVVWCGLNAEQDYLTKAFGDRAISVTGSMSPEEKVRNLMAWIDGERPILISKPSILGMGINMQHCARMIFVGLSDSYEAYYQAIRRCYRYGQTRVVDAHVVLSDLESVIATNVARKEREAARMTSELVVAMQAARATP